MPQLQGIIDLSIYCLHYTKAKNSDSGISSIDLIVNVALKYYPFRVILHPSSIINVTHSFLIIFPVCLLVLKSDIMTLKTISYIVMWFFFHRNNVTYENEYANR